MKVIYGKCYENKKVRAKGKVFRDCYFESCNMIDDEYTIYRNCTMSDVKTSKRSLGSNCVLFRTT